MFWKHMALAHLITGIDSSAAVTGAVWGKTHPVAKTGGGFEVMHLTRTADFGRGLLLRQQGSITGGINSNPGLQAITPKSAYQLDRKMDDGLPNTGDVQGDSEFTLCDSGNASNSVYLVNDERKNCLLFFSIMP